MNLGNIELEKVFVSLICYLNKRLCLRLFVKSLTADNKYSLCNLHTLTQIQTLLSVKQKTFSRFFIADVKCALNLENILRLFVSST